MAQVPTNRSTFSSLYAHHENNQTRIYCTPNPTISSNSGSSTSALSLSPLPHTRTYSMNGATTAWEPATNVESQNESLPPRIRLKKKRKPYTEFRIIRESSAPLIQHHTTTTDLKPIPNPPWANDSYSQDSSHHDDTRGKGPQQQNCTNSRKSSSSAECSTQTPQIHHHDEYGDDDDEDDIAVASAVLKQLQQQRRSRSSVGTETNTFPPPARPSRKQKRYACDVCSQIFTRSGDVRRHKESRHDNSEGCRCPFCDRVLTRSNYFYESFKIPLSFSHSFFFPFYVLHNRQDALQRHWDKYCRKKSKRHLDKQQSSETQTRNTTTPINTPLYTTTSSPQTTSTTNIGIGTRLDQVIILSSKLYDF